MAMDVTPFEPGPVVNNSQAQELAERFISREMQVMRACFDWRAEGAAKDLAMMKARWRGRGCGPARPESKKRLEVCQRSISRKKDL